MLKKGRVRPRNKTEKNWIRLKGSNTLYEYRSSKSKINGS